MDRSTGYWWAPDGKHIAFARVDETPDQSDRALRDRGRQCRDLCAALSHHRRTQRAGPAGRRRYQERRGHVGRLRCRARYLSGAGELAAGRQDAWQSNARAATSENWICCLPTSTPARARTVLTETSNTWIDLNDELSFLKNSHEFIWASSARRLHAFVFVRLRRPFDPPANGGQLGRR